MPAVKRMFKVNRQEIERAIALATVTEDEVTETSLRVFCEMFSILLDKSSIKAQVAELEILAVALKSAKK